MFNIYTDDQLIITRRVATFIALGAVLLLAACHRPAPPPAPPANVVAQLVHPIAASDGAGPKYTIEVASRYSNVMSFRVAGKITERKVRLGDRVHRGAVVARLDAVDAAKQAAAAKAVLEAAEHRLVFARQQLERDKTQHEQNLIAVNQFEQTEDAYVAALAGRDQAANQWTVASNALSYTALIADHDGVITSENADTGQVVAAGQAVYGLAWSGNVDVVLDAAANDLGKLTIGQSADVAFTALPGRRFAARVREIAPDADPQSRTYRVKLTLVDAAAEVHLGMTGDASLSAGNRPTDALLFKIPATAIFHQGRNTAVWIVRQQDSTLELRPVKVTSYAERSILVNEGLVEGDNLVVAGVHTVYAGERVKPIAALFASEGVAPAVAVSP
jgi:membrane fusion protein, multidrug efflux system